MARTKSQNAPPSQGKPEEPLVPAAGQETLVVGVEGNEILMIDSLLPSVHKAARLGDSTAVDQVAKLLDLRLKYRRQQRAEEDA